LSPAIGCDFLVVGAGIAGASVAYWLAPHGRTVVLERESQPGYHATGRSAAQYIATYGTSQVRALTQASLAFLEQPPAGFADTAILARRGALTIASNGQETLLDEAWRLLRSVTDTGQRLDAEAARAMVPVLRRDRVAGAILEPDSYDIDVHTLHQGFLRSFKRAGGRVVVDAQVEAIVRTGEGWRVATPAASYESPVLVNAAGAWCDVLACMAGVAPVGLVPRRRTAFTFRPPAGLDVSRWPLVIAADHGFYFKPDAGMLLGSPANADATGPQDVQPEELDIALGMQRIEDHTTLSVRPEHSWAGLRSFVADGDLVGGFDDDRPGFFWCAGQGGYGIQTAPAMGQACAALVRGQPLPEQVARFGLTPAMLSPRRLRPAPR
jgi:D-arginine dehydrogenase